MVQFKNAYKTPTNFYLFLELCNGGDLSKLLKIRGHLDEEEARLILIKVAEGVKDLHRKGILHRDLKLANVLLHFPTVDLYNQNKVGRESFLKKVNLKQTRF